MYTNGGLKRTHSHPFSRTFTALSLFIFLIIRKLITPSFTYIQLSCSAFLRYDYVRTISFLSLAQSQTRGTASDTGLPLAVSPRGKSRKFRRVCIVFFFFFLQSCLALRPILAFASLRVVDFRTRFSIPRSRRSLPRPRERRKPSWIDSIDRLGSIDPKRRDYKFNNEAPFNEVKTAVRD